MSKRESNLLLMTFMIITGIICYFIADLYLDTNHKVLESEVVEVEMVKLVNIYRESNSLEELENASWLDYGANQRATEMAEYGSHRYEAPNGQFKSHTRPDGTSWSNVFNGIEGTAGNERYLSENIALIQIHKRQDEKWLAKTMFETWRNSPSHNAAMLSPENKSMSFKVAQIPRHVDSYSKQDRLTYIGVQIFDTYDKAR